MELLIALVVLCVSVFLLLLGSYKALEFVTIRLAVRNDDRFDEIAADDIRKRLGRAVERRRDLLENKRTAHLEADVPDLHGWESTLRQFVVAHGEIIETTREKRVFDERFHEFRTFVDGLLRDTRRP